MINREDYQKREDYQRRWMQTYGLYVRLAYEEWTQLKLAYGQFESYTNTFEVAGRLNFIKYHARSLFWDHTCCSPNKWNDDAVQYYEEFCYSYDGWSSFLTRLPIQTKSNQLSYRLLHRRPPKGCMPHPDSSWALAEALDWSHIADNSLLAEISLVGNNIFLLDGA